MESRITLNVSGRRFELTRQTLVLLPTVYNAPFDTGEELFIARSPLVFEHVLALVLDPKHPFPLAYAYELDYYGVVYEKQQLCDSEGVLLALVKESISALNVQGTRVEEKIGLLREGGFAQESLLISSWCMKDGCGQRISFYGWCNDCRKICTYEGCRKDRPTGHNQCKTHSEMSLLCFVSNCVNNRINGTRRCFYHAKMWTEKTVK